MFTSLKKIFSATPTGGSLFLTLVISLLTLLAVGTVVVAADTTYLVSNDSEVPVRSGQGTEFKIISLLQNGEKVISLEEDGYWIKIRTATGREGWMLKRYLSSNTPPPLTDAFSLPTKTKQPTEDAEALTLAAEEKPDAAQPEAGVLPENSAPLQLENSSPSLAEQKLHSQDKELEELRGKLASVTLEKKELQENERIKWFLAGGGVLFIGWIIGLITCRSRKRKPSLL
ncbi:MAG: TIGR04211 family SH3 domain-containing protein [Desulfobulbaceae bacterium]